LISLDESVKEDSDSETKGQLDVEENLGESAERDTTLTNDNLSPTEQSYSQLGQPCECTEQLSSTFGERLHYHEIEYRSPECENDENFPTKIKTSPK
jgi:hypothetical protein